MTASGGWLLTHPSPHLLALIFTPHLTCPLTHTSSHLPHILTPSHLPPLPSHPTQYSRYEALIDAEDTDQDAIVQIMCKKAKWPPEVGCAVFDFAKLCIITKAKDRPPMNQVRLNTHTQSETDTHCPLRPVCPYHATDCTLYQVPAWQNHYS